MSLMQHNGQHSPRVSLVYLQLICAMLFFGLSFVFTAIALGELGPITIIMVRLCVSVLILLLLSQVTPVTAIVGKLENIKKGHRRYFVILAIFQPFLYFLCENTGLLYASPAVTSIVIATIPVVTPVFAFFLLKERITLFTVLGALLSLGGVGIIVLAGGEEGGAHPLGVALVFGAVLAAVGYSIAIRYVPNRYSPLSIVAWQNSMGLVFFAPLLLIFEPPLATLAELPGPHVLGALLFLGLFPSTVSFIFLGNGIRVIGVTKANLTTNTVPVFAAGFSIAVLGEPFRWITFLGMAVVISGVLLGTRLKKQP